jgi:hypothetical protein
MNTAEHRLKYGDDFFNIGGVDAELLSRQY